MSSSPGLFTVTQAKVRKGLRQLLSARAPDASRDCLSVLPTASASLHPKLQPWLQTWLLCLLSPPSQWLASVCPSAGVRLALKDTEEYAEAARQPPPVLRHCLGEQSAGFCCDVQTSPELLGNPDSYSSIPLSLFSLSN